MNEMVALRGVDPREILQTALNEKVPAVMSYLSKGKWHVAKVLLTALEADRFSVESTCSGKKPYPINIQIGQPVGVSFKYGYGKFVFDTTVVDFDVSAQSNDLEPSSNATTGGSIVLAVPDRVEVVQRRSYFRVTVPKSLTVAVVLWHRSQRHQSKTPAPDFGGLGRADVTDKIHDYYQGKLVDISAGGAQVVVDAGPAEGDCRPPVADRRYSTENQESKIENFAGGLDFRKGQFVGLRFTPIPYEMPVVFNAQIRNILPTEDRRSVYLGLQIVGLESSREGRQVLSRLVGVVERYYRMNQSGVRQPVSAMAD